MNEILLAQKWIYDKLSADGEINAIIPPARLFANQGPEDPEFPIIVYNYLAGPDTRGNSIYRIQANPLFQIKVICVGAPDTNVRSAAHRIDALFQPAVTESSESYIFSSRREEPVNYVEPIPNSSDFYSHIGGLYRLAIYPEVLGV